MISAKLSICSIATVSFANALVSPAPNKEFILNSLFNL